MFSLIADWNSVRGDLSSEGEFEYLKIAENG